MVIVDSNHRFVSVNRMCCEIFGYTEEDMLGKTIEDVTHPDHLDQDTRGMQDLYAGKIARYHTEKQYIRKDGSVIWGSLTVSPLRDRTGKIVSTIGLVEEIADWKEKGTEDTQ
jgi:PAS domain S-box-containing protein